MHTHTCIISDPLLLPLINENYPLLSIGVCCLLRMRKLCWPVRWVAAYALINPCAHESSCSFAYSSTRLVGLGIVCKEPELEAPPSGTSSHLFSQSPYITLSVSSVSATRSETRAILGLIFASELFPVARNKFISGGEQTTAKEKARKSERERAKRGDWMS